MRRGVTIGQAAAFAGVTVKTVRHYHRLGLVDEPARDASGYRRYSSTDLLRLVQVRTLAAAGVPLAEVPALLDAAPDAFAAAVSDVGRRLTEQIDELVARRSMLERLAVGDRVLLPDHACAVLDSLAALGFDAGYVEAQREGMILVRALVPEGFDTFVTQIQERLADPTFVELQKRSWEAASWDADDPRLPELADATAENLLRSHLPNAVPSVYRARADAIDRLGFISRHRAEEVPAIARFNELVEARLRAAGVVVPS